MNLEFSVEAKRDLDELRQYLGQVSPDGLANVVAALEASIITAMEFPRVGRQTTVEDIREIVEAKYGYIIPYCVRGNDFCVLPIHNARRRRLDYSTLEIP